MMLLLIFFAFVAGVDIFVAVSVAAAIVMAAVFIDVFKFISLNYLHHHPRNMIVLVAGSSISSVLPMRYPVAVIVSTFIVEASAGSTYWPMCYH